MPLYTFELRDGFCGIADTIGVSLADRDQALCYAHEVVRELMGCCEKQTRTWQLDVYEDHDQRIFEIPFARLDETLDHLDPGWRRTIEDSCNRSLLLRETCSAARITMRESRALVARSRGKPYLATEGGKPIIREGDEKDSASAGHVGRAAARYTKV
jgi:hypothetical protein